MSNVIALRPAPIAAYDGASWRYPGDGDRVFVCGRTGSGKSVLNLWLLSNASYQRRPWIVVDYKREPVFTTMLKNRLFRGALKPSSSPPRSPGLYLLRPFEHDAEAVDDFFWRILRRGRIGLFFDEAGQVPAGQGSAVRAILTMGRSLRIPVLAGNQRPVSMGDRNFIEQADFICCFQLIGDDDRKIIKGYMPVDPDQIRALPEFWSYWYDVKRDRLYRLTPRPREGHILGQIADRTPRRLFGL